MSKDVTIEQGDCFSKIAFENGFFWETLWDDDSNAQLKSDRKSPFVLKPGDAIHVPDLREKSVSVASGKSHTFKRKGVPAQLKIKLEAGGQPLANQPFELDIDGNLVSGTTDGTGLVSAYLPPNAARCKLTVGSGASKREYVLGLRQLDPETEVSGVQARLRNLGYYTGEVSGELDDLTRDAIIAFQKAQQMDQTGENDSALQSKLRELQGA